MVRRNWDEAERTSRRFPRDNFSNKNEYYGNRTVENRHGYIVIVSCTQT